VSGGEGRRRATEKLGFELVFILWKHDQSQMDGQKLLGRLS
jgi:hypothetical protein